MSKTITHQQLKDIADEAGIKHDDIFTDYSGRGMYGKLCAGFALRYEEQIADVAAATVEVMGKNVLGRPTTDSLGRRIVAYWPAWQVIDVEEE